jgi:hypothetical protein
MLVSVLVTQTVSLRIRLLPSLYRPQSSALISVDVNPSWFARSPTAYIAESSRTLTRTNHR